MLLLAAQVVDETSTAYGMGRWVGRLVLVVLVILLVSKYVFKVDTARLTVWRRRPRRASGDGAPPNVPGRVNGPVTTLAQDILPAAARGQSRRNRPWPAVSTRAESGSPQSG